MNNLGRILFRGISEFSQKWVYGFPFKIEDKWYLVENGEVMSNRCHDLDCGCQGLQCYKYPDFLEVIPETVGQWTGVYDTKNKLICDEDYVRDSFGGNYVVKYCETYMRWELIERNYSFVAVHMVEFCHPKVQLKVTGSIHDHLLRK